MQTAIILHGKTSKENYYDADQEALSNKHWLPWLQRQLLLKDILAQTPELPKPYDPEYYRWKDVFEQFKVDENTHLIGYSCGAGFLARWLSENDVKVGKVALVAPWIDPESKINNGFFDFEIDPNLTEHTDGITIFVSKDDDAYNIKSAEILHQNIKETALVEINGCGHFMLRDMGTREFPELLELFVDIN